jgi:hypothetical protein
MDAAMRMVARAEEEVAAGIAFLQRAQEVEWSSVAGDVMREELCAAIQVLRSIDGELAESRRELAVLSCILDELGPVAA